MARTVEQRDGLEVVVEAGYGWITGLEEKGRNAQVTIRADHPSMREPVTGWVDTTALELFGRVRDAAATGARIGYRVVVKRKPDAPRDKAIADLSNRQKVRDLEELLPAPPAADPRAQVPNGLRVDHSPTAGDVVAGGPPAEAPTRYDDAGEPVRMCGTCSTRIADNEALRKVAGVYHHLEGKCPVGGAPTTTPPPSAADPHDGSGSDPSIAEEAHGWLTEAGREATAARHAEVSAAAATVEDAAGTFPCGWCPGLEPFVSPEALAGHALEVHPDKVQPAAGAPPRPPGRDGKRGPKVAEPRPWVRYVDGPVPGESHLNLGSYEVLAAEGTVLFAHDLLLAHARYLAEEEGKPMAPPTAGQIKGLARRLLRAADLTQVAQRTYAAQVDRMAMSHTRARGCVRAALEAHPVPWGADPAALDEWVGRLAGYASELLKVTLQLVDPEPLP